MEGVELHTGDCMEGVAQSGLSCKEEFAWRGIELHGGVAQRRLSCTDGIELHGGVA